MPFHIRDAATDQAVRELAARTGLSLTDAVRQAAENELNRLNRKKRPLAERVRDIQARARAYAPTGLAADKVFYDELSGDL
ncbi:type II toxin-antitoxin system VapB family antitoxin [Rhodoblastus sp.]|uniref:type II toxin-antitoxin system VapB family antitoxin n=1 Tax=Rhodoblastus sp. TaxID=1962975 RepID=UPI003F9982E3